MIYVHHKLSKILGWLTSVAFYVRNLYGVLLLSFTGPERLITYVTILIASAQSLSGSPLDCSIERAASTSERLSLSAAPFCSCE